MAAKQRIQKSENKKGSQLPTSTVDQLIKEGRWDWEEINRRFSEEDRKEISKVPISMCGGKDKLSWIHSPMGIYTVKIGYAVAKVMKQRNFPGIRNTVEGRTEHSIGTTSSKEWEILWKLPLKHKLKFFIWRYIQGMLPVNELIKQRSGKGDARCKCCGHENETIEHTFFSCEQAESI